MHTAAFLQAGGMRGEFMCEFIMEIAGKRVAVTCSFEKTRDFCSEYLISDGPVDFSVRVRRDDVYAELEKSRLEAEVEGIPFEKLSAYDYEQSALYRKLAEKLLEHDTLLFHGSAISVDGEAYLFTAASGTGKSTHTSLWRQTFGDRAVMVNDDKPFLELSEDGVWLHGSPWSGKHGLDTNIRVPLKGICILERGVENRIVPATPEEAIPMLQKQAYASLEEAKYPLFLTLTEALSHRVSLWKMACNKEPAAARIAYCAMSGNEMRE